MSPIESACLTARLSTLKSIEVSFEFTVELRHSASFRVQATWTTVRSTIRVRSMS